MAQATKKALVVLGVGLGLGGGLLIALPAIFGDRVGDALLARANAQLSADIAIGGSSVGLWRDFPHLTLTAKDVQVTGKGSFEGVQMLRAGEVAVTVDLASALGDTLEIRGVHLRDAQLDLRVDHEGRSNMDFVPSQGAETAGEGPPPSVRLSAISLTNVDLSYVDRQGGQALVIKGLDHQGAGSVGGDTVAYKTHTEVQAISFEDGGVALLRQVPLIADVDLDLNLETGAVVLGETRIQLAQVGLEVVGSANPTQAGTELDLTFHTPQTDFGAALSLIPAAYSADLKGLEAGGSFEAGGHVRGLLPDEGEALPGFELAVKVVDGRFRYAGQPVGVDAVALDLHIAHPGGAPDRMVVDLPRFSMSVDGAPLSGAVRIATPVSDPDISAKLKGKADLGRLRAALPPDPALVLQGSLEADLDVAGKTSDFAAQRVEKVRASGFLRMGDVVYQDADLVDPVHIDRLDVRFDTKTATLTALDVRTGPSDLRLSGEVSNLLGYALADGTLGGQLRLEAGMLDVDRLGGDEDQSTTDEEDGVAVVPENLDLRLDLKADRVRASDKDYADVRGGVGLRRGVLTLDKMGFAFLDGRVQASGTYTAKTPRKAEVDMELQMATIQVAGAVAEVETLQKIAPIGKNLDGRFRSKARIKSSLGPGYSPELQSLESVGDLRTLGVVIRPRFLKDVEKTLKASGLGLDLSDADVGFQIRNGRLDLSPIQTRLGQLKARLSGSTGTLDRSLDLKLVVHAPASLVGQGGNDTIPVRFDITGTFDNPKVKVDLGGVVAQVEDEVRDVARGVADDLLAEARAQGDALVEAAEKAAAVLVKEAEKAGDKLRSVADKEGDKLVAKAKGNPIAEKAAKEAAKKLRKEADKQADKLVKAAKKKGDQGVSKAKTERDRLIAQAERSAAGATGRP